MKLLSVAAVLHRIHHDILSRHERQLRHQVLRDHFVVDHKSVNHVETQVKDTVDRKKSFGDREPLIRRVVERPLEPLCRGGDRRI